jgi:glutamate racemase
VLATIGGPDALGAVKSAINDADETVQDEAVGILATWPNNWPEDTTVAEPLLALVNSGKKPAHKIQGARGYLLHLQENKKLSNADKLAAVEKLVPSLKLPQEKRLVISTLGNIPTQKTLDLLATFASDAGLAEEACLATVNVASARNVEGATKESRQKALQMVLEKSKSDATREKANAALRRL